MRRRLSDYLNFLAWQSGLGYLALWGVTFWALDEGIKVFGDSGSCHPDVAKVLFYWVCEPGTWRALLANVVNSVFTVTIWAPVYVAAATVRSDFIMFAAPILFTHIVGLPTAIFVMMRMMLALLQSRHRLSGNKTAAEDSERVMPAVKTEIPPPPSFAPQRYKPIKARGTFGLRNSASQP